VFELGFATAKSRIPSPLKSPDVIEYGLSAILSNALWVNVPLPLFNRIEIVLEPEFPTARSRAPSPLKSPVVSENGAVPTPGVDVCVNVPFPLFN